MPTIKKFLELNNPQPGYYSHEDQNVHGLRFRVFYSNPSIALYLIKGEQKAVENYMARFGAGIKEVPTNEMVGRVHAFIPPRTEPCDMCDGTGHITIPPFDPEEALKEPD